MVPVSGSLNFILPCASNLDRLRDVLPYVLKIDTDLLKIEIKIESVHLDFIDLDIGENLPDQDNINEFNISDAEENLKGNCDVMYITAKSNMHDSSSKMIPVPSIVPRKLYAIRVPKALMENPQINSRAHQCTGITKKGMQCRRRTCNPSRKCHDHLNQY